MSAGPPECGAYSRHVVLLVHGIRTFGAWQDRMVELLRRREPQIEVLVYKYGYFGSCTFALPILRSLVMWRFQRYLASHAEHWRAARVDIVAHSFGTWIAAWALRGLRADHRPPIHTIILCGSVLKPSFPWEREQIARRVINDCGQTDLWPLVAQIVPLCIGMGAAGRRGFSGIIGVDVGIVNRFFPFGHGGFFAEEFMESQWLPLLTGLAPPAGPELVAPTPGWSAALEPWIDAIKVVVLCLVLFVPLLAAAEARARAERARADVERARADVEQAKREKLEETLAREKAEQQQRQEAQARRDAERRQQEEEALKLVAEANRLLYRVPHQALLLARRAAEIGRTPPAVGSSEAALRLAREVLGRRRRVQMEDAEWWRPGFGFFSPVVFEGVLSAQLSRDGRYTLLATDRRTYDQATEGIGPGDAYLVDNEVLKPRKLEPPVRRDPRKRRLEYVGFSSSGRKIYLSRQFNVEVYSIDGAFERELLLSEPPRASCRSPAPAPYQSTKVQVVLVDSVQDDRLLIAADTAGQVWLVDARTGCVGRSVVDGHTANPLQAFEVSPSGTRATMVHKEGEAFVWLVGDEHPKSRTRIPHRDHVVAATFKPTDKEEIVLTVGRNGVVSLWRIRSAGLEHLWSVGSERAPVRYAAFSPDARRILTLGDDDREHVWEASTGQPVAPQ